jgi:hypothetical protein
MIFKRIPERPNDELLDLIRKSRSVGVHGANCSGKSFLSRELAQLVGGTHVEIDNHLSTPRLGRTYLHQVKFDEVKNEIQKSTPPIILDCFILLDVLEKMNLNVDFTLFCERACGNVRFNPENEDEFESYEKRRQPRKLAKQIFTLVYPN